MIFEMEFLETTEPIGLDMDYESLRAVAEAADNGGRPWEWHGGYPQQVIRQGDAMLVAETYEGPDFPSTVAEFIATFDPPTVLRLLDALDE